ncbi:hypothetical protein HPB50_018620 [Hyalomma asiaticum]|uniref:Uncharacterized protein n=1 Tax=Hyalomma asiaticum TaxID=266040 RepID=A0ACB7SGN9_HYAAI|nr:hypothetical protein HPB50_018620 [Hyalomma asiaticum]
MTEREGHPRLAPVGLRCMRTHRTRRHQRLHRCASIACVRLLDARITPLSRRGKRRGKCYLQLETSTLETKNPLRTCPKALRTRQEHAERLVRLAERRPFSANLPVNKEASPSTPQAVPNTTNSVAAFPAPQESPDITEDCSQPCGPASVPLPQNYDTKNTSDDEGSSRKVPAVTPAPMSGTPTSRGLRVLHDAHDGFQMVQSKSQERRQYAAAAAGTAVRCVPPSGSTNNGSSAAAAAPPAIVTTTPTSVSTRASHQQCGITVLFRPAIPGATFLRTSRLSLAQALSALPGVQERYRRLATTELAGIPVNARMLADRTQSAGIVEGTFGNYTEEELLADVQSDVPVLAAKRQGTALILRFAASTACPGVGAMAIPQPHATEHSDACAVAAGLTGIAPPPVSPGASTVVEHTADSSDCQLWQRERRLATIKATAPVLPNA